MTQKIKDLEGKVLKMLEENERTRNDDVTLHCSLIAKYMPNEIKNEDGRWWISTYAGRIIREVHVVRLRSKIQNTLKLFPPTDPAVRKRRSISEEQWYQYMRRRDCL